jgi:hypothetical protein
MALNEEQCAEYGAMYIVKDIGGTEYMDEPDEFSGTVLYEECALYGVGHYARDWCTHDFIEIELTLTTGE